MSGLFTLFTRDGHLTGLTLERLAHDELEPDERTALQAHLGGCERCQQRASTVAEPLALPAPRLPPSVLAPPSHVPEPANAPWSARAAIGVGLALAAAGVLAVGLRQPVVSGGSPEDPGAFRTRGGELGLEVFRKATGMSDVLVDGAAVRPGDTLGFRVSARRDGWVLLAGVDGQGEVYPVWPADSPHAAQQVTGDARPRAIDVAIQLDDAPGNERLVLVSCEDPFSLNDVSPQLLSLQRPRCVSKTVTLRKAP